MLNYNAPQLRINILTVNKVCSIILLYFNGVRFFLFVFVFFRSDFVREAALMVSNILTGNPDQIQLVIDAQILQPLIEVLIRVI
jgi:hypothetical protein